MMFDRTIAAGLVAVAGLAACAPDGTGPATTTTPAATAATTEPQAPTRSTPVTTAPATTEPAPTTQAPAPTLPQPVPEEGSVRDLISRRDDLSNINAAIEAWLADSEGREGVLRNSRGVTVFLPNDDGFTEDDLAAALDDFDGFTIFLSEHLRVGALTSAELGDEVTTAMGVTYPVGDGPSIGDRLIVEADIEATNGVIHIIDGPLVPIG